MLVAIDAWRAKQPGKPVRPEAIRRLIAAALKVYAGLGTLPAPERIHAEGSPGDSVDIPQKMLDSSTDESESTGEPKAAAKKTPDAKQEP